MDDRLSHRKAIKAAGAVWIPSAASGAVLSWPMVEGLHSPKICMGAGKLDQAGIRRVTQLGVGYVVGGAPGPIPWQESVIRKQIADLKAGGLTLYNMMISGYPKAQCGLPGRDEEIEKVRQSIRGAGRAGLPVIEYTFQPHRAMEGYFEQAGRGGAGLTGFDYDRVKNLPPFPGEGAYSLEQMWDNLIYFVKAVVPVAEESGVRLALHPNDPPAPLIRGTALPLGTVDGWKRLIEIVDSPSNGITFDCGMTREMNQDPVEMCRYFGTRDRINHMHFRNVRMQVPREKYTEVFPDEGEVNMFAVMQELVRQKYPRTIYPEHPRALDYDRERARASGGLRAYYPGGGGYAGEVYNVAYARAMLQAALSAS